MTLFSSGTASAPSPTFTPGPWRWEINLKSRQVQLCGDRAYDHTVMDFVRWGMGGAQPRFLVRTQRGALLEGAEKFPQIVPGREHHSAWFQTLSHPDAVLMQSAPTLYDAANVALGHMTGGMDGDWRDCDPRELLRAALSKALGQ